MGDEQFTIGGQESVPMGGGGCQPVASLSDDSRAYKDLLSSGRGCKRWTCLDLDRRAISLYRSCEPPHKDRTIPVLISSLLFLLMQVVLVEDSGADIQIKQKMGCLNLYQSFGI